MAGGVDMLDAQHMAREAARPFSDIAVLCRTRRQLEQIETCLAHDSIPCVIYGRDAFLRGRGGAGRTGFFRLADGPAGRALTHRLPHRAVARPRAPCANGRRRPFRKAPGEADRPAFLRRELSDFSPLAPWLDAAEALFPRMAREKPPQAAGRAVRPCGAEKAGPWSICSARRCFSPPWTGCWIRCVRRGRRISAARLGRGVSVRRGAADDACTAPRGWNFPWCFSPGSRKEALPLERETPPRPTRRGGTQALFRRHHPARGRS